MIYKDIALWVLNVLLVASVVLSVVAAVIAINIERKWRMLRRMDEAERSRKADGGNE